MKDTQYTAKVFSNCQSKCCKAPIAIIVRIKEERKCFIHCAECGEPCEYEYITSWFRRLLNKFK